MKTNIYKNILVYCISEVCQGFFNYLFFTKQSIQMRSYSYTFKKVLSLYGRS